MSCSFWLRRKRLAAEKAKAEKQEAVSESTEKAPAKKVGAKGDGRTSKKS